MSCVYGYTISHTKAIKINGGSYTSYDFICSHRQGLAVSSLGHDLGPRTTGQSLRASTFWQVHGASSIGQGLGSGALQLIKISSLIATQLLLLHHEQVELLLTSLRLIQSGAVPRSGEDAAEAYG